MPEPRGLSFGAPAPQLAPAPQRPPVNTVEQQPLNVPAFDMKVSGPIAGQQLVPIKATEVGELGRTAAAGAASIADKITSVVRAGDIDEVGKSLNNLLVTAKKYDPSTFKKGGGFFGFVKTSVQQLKNQFATVDNQVDQLMTETDTHVAKFKGRIGDLEILYNENEARYHDLGGTISEVERRIQWMRDNPPTIDPSDSFSAQHLADWNTVITMAEKRVDDLKRGQQLCQLQAPQIKLMQQNAGSLVQKFGQVKTETIPALKQAFALYILNLEMEKGADFATAITDETNDVLTANAAKLGVTTVKVQQTLARSSIDMSTLQTIQAAAIKSLDDVQRIRTEMQTRLQQERPQLEALSQQLTQRLGQ